RGVSYLIAGLYCAGARSIAVSQAEAAGEYVSNFFGFCWYMCCLALILGSVASFWAWHGDRRSALLDSPGGPDLDAYYISS
ncbi:unnamed protein product, partial [Symbiodinium sp. CCMP2456]